ncbi:MAG: PEP-CTERM sorting domain-containing protein [Desulfobacula sp.]|uniref:PEP-CTERM sorting domain-containing protein n=1 Tax=Desulfobacula sp. TaxID=2593537 RepID=UPI0025C3B9F6|nr:PEP-CTERM sorting domain-containing protein [Desulfobacula sp.]MCD4719145.1 PEP-CTERM sorting domain-containing protein [Desulfobacula sp.]
MKNYLLGLIVLISAFAFTTNVFGYTLGATYGWTSTTDPYYLTSANIHNGTIDTGDVTLGDFIQRGSGSTSAGGFGSSGSAVGWDDTWVGGVGNANTNGDFLDGLWSQIYSDGGWWDLGSAFSEVAVFSSQDHGPYPAEGIEYYIYGANSIGGTLSLAATLTDIYLDGWRTHNSAEDSNGNGWLSDDLSTVFDLGSSYQYIKLVAWGGGSFTEPEIDAVGGFSSAPVPEPTTMLLFGLGLLGLAGVSRKKQ